KEAYKTSWNYNALQFTLCHALPQCIKDVLCLTPKQLNYNDYKALITQIDQQYWEDCSEYSAPWAPSNSSGNCHDPLPTPRDLAPAPGPQLPQNHPYDRPGPGTLPSKPPQQPMAITAQHRHQPPPPQHFLRPSPP
ncbi:hypothetical protein C0993_010519, partial [Termitomyces sp. T159_Od127]